ncbi:MAG: hypothetical protein JW997_00455, partial [Actinobacteria bacterium]|nr:hypothetical protein [Actinomycetota bacterium]
WDFFVMKSGQKIKKAQKLVLFAAAIIMITCFVFLFFPNHAYCNYSDFNFRDKPCLSSKSLSENVCPTEDYRTAVKDNRGAIYPILITSIIVLGVLIFAMWQTFKNKKHI